VHYIIVAGDESALAVSESGFFFNTYDWGLEEEIDLDSCGTQKVEVDGQPPDDYAVNLLAFKHLSMEVTLDEEYGTNDPIQWGKGMHFLGWSVALRNVRPQGERVTADLDLFYKCWSTEMNEVITLTTWGAFRAAGRAAFKANLALLQMRQGQQRTLALPGTISWPGGGLSARNHPRAIFERPAEPTHEPTA
jgi:hypothetical protein